jgi:DNA repair protein RadC
MAHLTVERVRVLYLDTEERLIRDEHLGDGSLMKHRSTRAR